MDFKKEKTKLEKAFTEKRYQQRFSVVKEGKACLEKRDIVGAAKKYHEYLQILALVYHSKPFDLKPDLFVEATGETEQLLLSQVYYDLAKIYDLSEKKTIELQQSLAQFVRFTLNQRYQVLNSETIRKDIKAKRIKNKEEFSQTMNQIYKESKKCYLATYVYGENHPTTMILRSFRDQKLQASVLGRAFINLYYYLSPKMITYSHQRPFIDQKLKKIISYLVEKVISRLGLK